MSPPAMVLADQRGVQAVADAVGHDGVAESTVAAEQALTEDGDERIALTRDGINLYGCPPRPDASLIALGSSTASVISAPAFAAAQALYLRLKLHPARYGHEADRIRREIGLLTGAALVPDAEVVLAASGTDVHVMALHVARRNMLDIVQAVMVDACETGSGVTAALSRQPFCEGTHPGHGAEEGGARARACGPKPMAVALRHEDGSLRDAAEVDFEFRVHVQTCLRAGRRCLIVMTDVSKTGVLAPSVDCVRALAHRYPDEVEVLVDACQLRLAPDSVRDYLSDGFMVAITGSKFVTGPAFSGALLVPAPMAQRVRAGECHAGGAGARSPDRWFSRAGFAPIPTVGVLLRWEAALTELKLFVAVGAGFTRRFLQDWGAAVESMLAGDDMFVALPVPPIRRRSDASGQRWDTLQTIFPFRLSLGAGGRPLEREETASLHRAVRHDPRAFAGGGRESSDTRPSRFELGQPVPCGVHRGVPVSALRLCASARMIARAFHDGHGAEPAKRDAAAALDRLRQMVRRLS
jgi:hypothetical protein